MNLEVLDELLWVGTVDNVTMCPMNGFANECGSYLYCVTE